MRNKEMPFGFEVVTSGGTKSTGKDAVEWANEAEERGAGILLPTSMDGDGKPEHSEKYSFKLSVDKCFR